MAKKQQKVDAVKHVEENGFPEVGHFTEKKDLQKFYKQLDDVVLGEWIAIEGLEFKPCEDSEAINRMRMCMAILYLHFPKQPSAKKKAKYADYTMEQLMKMCLDNDVAVEYTESEQIMRMRTIMALRAAGHIEKA